MGGGCRHGLTWPGKSMALTSSASRSSLRSVRAAHVPLQAGGVMSMAAACASQDDVTSGQIALAVPQVVKIAKLRCAASASIEPRFKIQRRCGACCASTAMRSRKERLMHCDVKYK
jgi:hypothetical protein